MYSCIQDGELHIFNLNKYIVTPHNLFVQIIDWTSIFNQNLHKTLSEHAYKNGKYTKKKKQIPVDEGIFKNNLETVINTFLGILSHSDYFNSENCYGDILTLIHIHLTVLKIQI